ncbi:MAG: CAP domain-containing protein [Methyloligellaceae bacterium]
MLRTVFSALIVVSLSACSGGGPAIEHTSATLTPMPTKVSLNLTEAREIINGYRKRNGVKPLKLHPLLTKAAKAHSSDLARSDSIAHKGSDGSDPWVRVQRTGYKPRLAAENVGAGQMSLTEVFKGWQDSPGHDENLLLPDATHMGIALVHSPATEYKTFWTLVLGKPL